ncbi:bifunctional 2-polyprenyl-6-hydroxyphenol methylase/3-demethylubiquinol 3-O-methyltransferase UbiG [Bradyrhizobium arachidis]|uniref:class I SAM-dependent methyltransferase n=1 Tax=Bradyrhizobium arachidis TaxID=858423 RepID=UPI002163F3A5|nr:class I SAM-dependent methyltransferase [Bradyrhizobium arachidis]UVO26953.1 class I SAM-dependent methyltransferase [Bradyrhizobium arachidis]
MSSLALTFDRSDDISKPEGCDTRGIVYRWNIFATHLAVVPAGAEVLDFGAGSLRESFDLVQKGFSVTSVDVSAETLNEYKRKYDWPANGKHRLVANLDLFAALSELESQYALITAFDVLEHLADPVAALQELAKHLQDGGLMFVTVPNGWTLFELAFRTELMIARAAGRKLPPGEPHLQWHSPGAMETTDRTIRAFDCRPRHADRLFCQHGRGARATSLSKRRTGGPKGRHQERCAGVG